MYTVGGGGISTPALTRAIREFGEQAKKQLDETGSLAGFEGKFTDQSSGGGSVTVTVSALGMAAYDASAGKDDTFLAFTLETVDPNGTLGGGGTGSSLTIRTDQDIDAFIANFQSMAKGQHFASYLQGTPEELAAAGDSGAPAAERVAGAAGSNAPSQLFSKLEGQEAASKQLIDLLQGFLDGLAGSKRSRNPAGDTEHAGAEQGNAVRSRLAQFSGTDITT